MRRRKCGKREKRGKLQSPQLQSKRVHSPRSCKIAESGAAVMRLMRTCLILKCCANRRSNASIFLNEDMKRSLTNKKLGPGGRVVATQHGYDSAKSQLLSYPTKNFEVDKFSVFRRLQIVAATLTSMFILNQ